MEKTQSKEKLSEIRNDIPGWGIDADPHNNPTYPMKDWNGADHDRLHYDRPAQQVVEVELLRSVERPLPTAVFGTAPAPSGLSGMIRRFAFRYSESTYMHWFALVLADRINMIEGIVDDLIHGRIPNIPKELGLKADLKYDKKRTTQNIIIGVAVLTAVFILMKTKNARKKHSPRYTPAL